MLALFTHLCLCSLTQSINPYSQYSLFIHPPSFHPSIYPFIHSSTQHPSIYTSIHPIISSFYLIFLSLYYVRCSYFFGKMLVTEKGKPWSWKSLWKKRYSINVSCLFILCLMGSIPIWEKVYSITRDLALLAKGN